MNKTTVVVFLLLFSLPLRASELATSIANLESAWAQAYYLTTENQQKQQFPILLERANALAKQHPHSAEPKIWQAILLSTLAGHQTSLKALTTIKEAKILLEEAINLNPKALDGAAYVTLGTLYYMVPGWPIAFGDNQLAEHYLKTSLQINPTGIDANYFYADFLIQHGRANEAEPYLKKAAEVPIRKQQVLADSRMQEDARQALHNAKSHDSEYHRFLSVFNTVSE